MGFRVRGNANAGHDCRLCGEPLRDHGITEFCRDGDRIKNEQPPTDPKLQTEVLLLMGALYARRANVRVLELDQCALLELRDRLVLRWKGGRQVDVIRRKLIVDMAEDSHHEKHGTLYGYTRGKCRCDTCRHAMAGYYRQRRSVRALNEVDAIN